MFSFHKFLLVLIRSRVHLRSPVSLLQTFFGNS